MLSDSPSRCFLDMALRRYPSVVLQRSQKALRSAGDMSLMNLSNCSIPVLYRTVNKSSRSIYSPVFYSPHAHLHNLRMEDYDVVAMRRERLKEVIKNKFDGKQTRLVEETGINAGELSGLLRTRYFGEKKARSLETALKLPRLWLDGLAETKKPNPKKQSAVVADFEWTYNHVDDIGKGVLLKMIDAVKSGYLKSQKRKKA